MNELPKTPESEWLFWKPRVTNDDGTIDMEKLKRELFDFSTLMESAAEVYEHVTGGAVSKVNTLPEVVCSLADEHYSLIYSDR
jgi:hypothetical protein